MTFLALLLIPACRGRTVAAPRCLFIVAHNGRTATVAMLLKSGADKSLRGWRSDRTPLEIAQSQGHAAVVALPSAAPESRRAPPTKRERRAIENYECHAPCVARNKCVPKNNTSDTRARARSQDPLPVDAVRLCERARLKHDVLVEERSSAAHLASAPPARRADRRVHRRDDQKAPLRRVIGTPAAPSGTPRSG